MFDQIAIRSFREAVWDYYRTHGREMPWRPPSRKLREDKSLDPYAILVSEIMLQQTQVSRVIPKFISFTQRFPSFKALANASLADVLGEWSGLGYNRRAKFLWQAAQQIEGEYNGNLPTDLPRLTSLPGIGYNTAAAILNYAYNQPIAFVETNIRTALFHHFFTDDVQDVSDAELLAIAWSVLDHEHPREWHWALMDYGAYLKQNAGGMLDRSKHYKKQSTFKGSPREMRGRIVRALINGATTKTTLQAVVRADERFEPALKALTDEGLVVQTDSKLALTGYNG